jgi:hypothetical protein
MVSLIGLSEELFIRQVSLAVAFSLLRQRSPQSELSLKEATEHGTVC